MLDSDEEDEPEDERKEIEHELFKDDDELVSFYKLFLICNIKLYILLFSRRV